jgi:uncharacterized repeat protein (TIGR01451 family)
MMMGCVLGAFAQAMTAQDFVFTRLDAPEEVEVGERIVYSIAVSNATTFNLGDSFITSEYDTNLAVFASATNAFPILTNDGLVRFEIPIGNWPQGGVIEVLLELQGTNDGNLTNVFTVNSTNIVTIPEITNVITTIITPDADLGISVFGPANGVFPGDSFSYQLLATNAGPDAASEIIVSNPFPANVSLLSLSPSNSLSVFDGFVLFSVGTLTNEGSAIATVSVLATNAAATNLIEANISAPIINDTNAANDFALTNVPILLPDTNQLTVTGISGQALNLQTGWVEQRVRIRNIGTSDVASVRLLVGDLTNQLVALVNASGTNGTTPYAAHGGPLPAGGELDVLLEYDSPTRNTTGPDPTWQAYGTPPLDLSVRDGDEVLVDRILPIQSANLNQGRILLEWPVTTGARYQVVYDEQATFATAKRSSPVVVAPEGLNRVQWLDYGPPRTLTPPSNAPSRFYQVIELP